MAEKEGNFETKLELCQVLFKAKLCLANAVSCGLKILMSFVCFYPQQMGVSCNVIFCHKTNTWPSHLTSAYRSAKLISLLVGTKRGHNDEQQMPLLSIHFISVQLKMSFILCDRNSSG